MKRKPWLKSTGAKTAEGKAISKMNNNSKAKKYFRKSCDLNNPLGCAFYKNMKSMGY